MTGSRIARAALALVLGAAALGASAQSDEEKVGKAAAAQVLGAAPLLPAPELQRYLNLVGQSVAQFSGANYKWRFGIVRSDAVNAFAMPGGYILVSSGLLKLLSSEDELAFVLAHEVAHVSRRHHYQVVLRQRLADQAARGLQAVTQDNDTAKLAQASGQIYARGLDKGAEFESDRLGAEYMARAGYDPAAVLGVLEALQRFKGEDPRAALLFSTHPSASDRMEALMQSGIDRLPRPAAAAAPARVNRFRVFQQGL